MQLITPRKVGFQKASNMASMSRMFGEAITIRADDACSPALIAALISKIDITGADIRDLVTIFDFRLATSA